MAGAHGDEDWLYYLPAFLDQVREQGAHRVVENLDAEIGGVFYHHRGARVPGHNATFVWRDGTDESHSSGSEAASHQSFEIEIDTVGPRSAWAVFDADRNWDFYLSRVSGDAPCLAWMTDAEFDAEEAEAFEHKQEAIGMGRFSFGLYLQSPSAWDELEQLISETTAACVIHRPSGRTIVPEEGLEQYESALPSELLPDGDVPPDHLGLVEAHVSSDP